MLCGHAAEEAHRTVTNNAGEPVFEILANYQGRANGGDGWLRKMTFEPDENEIEVYTYSPTLDQFETDADSRFTLSLDFDERFGVVPEPATLALLLLGSLTVLRRRRK